MERHDQPDDVNLFRFVETADEAWATLQTRRLGGVANRRRQRLRLVI